MHYLEELHCYPEHNFRRPCTSLMNGLVAKLTSRKMAEIEEKIEQYKAYLSKYFENPREDKVSNEYCVHISLNITAGEI